MPACMKIHFTTTSLLDPCIKYVGLICYSMWPLLYTSYLRPFSSAWRSKKNHTQSVTTTHSCQTSSLSQLQRVGANAEKNVNSILCRRYKRSSFYTHAHVWQAKRIERDVVSLDSFDCRRRMPVQHDARGAVDVRNHYVGP